MMMNKIIALLKEEEGQSMVEYGIILALISVVAITVVQSVGGRVESTFSKIDGDMGSALGGGGGAAPPPAEPPPAAPPADGGL